jgi:hypothetical protein
VDALREAGYTATLVGERDELGNGTPDIELLSHAEASGETVLTGDFADFADQPHDDHCGVVLYNTDREPGEEPSVGTFLIGVERLFSRYDDLVGGVAFLREWFPG